MKQLLVVSGLLAAKSVFSNRIKRSEDNGGWDAWPEWPEECTDGKQIRYRACVKYDMTTFEAQCVPADAYAEERTCGAPETKEEEPASSTGSRSDKTDLRMDCGKLKPYCDTPKYTKVLAKHCANTCCTHALALESDCNDKFADNCPRYVKQCNNEQFALWLSHNCKRTCNTCDAGMDKSSGFSLGGDSSFLDESNSPWALGVN